MPQSAASNVDTEAFKFAGSNGATLAARFDKPAVGSVKAYALFAHCFTCSKDIFAANRIAQGLAAKGFGVLRFDFTGLGQSGGDFSHTNFSSNIDDLVEASAFMEKELGAPSLLIGHSLGGAAVLAAASRMPSVKAVVTLGAPADPGHVVENFKPNLSEIESQGFAEVKLAGRPFTIRDQFVKDLQAFDWEKGIANLKRALLVMHAPMDAIVDVSNAKRIFKAAKHPKSFVSLDTADHLLTKKSDAQFAADMISSWAQRYIDIQEEPVVQDAPAPEEGILSVSETGQSKFQQEIRIGQHRLLADEPLSVGGQDTGLAPYDFLLAGLGACTAMTLRIYAEFKKLPLEGVRVDLSHKKIHAKDCQDCETKAGKIDEIERVVHVFGDLSDEQRAKLLEIADKCPVHRTLEAENKVRTRLADEVA